MLAGSVEDGDDPAVEAILLKGKKQFALDPGGCYRGGRKGQDLSAAPISSCHCWAWMLTSLYQTGRP